MAGPTYFNIICLIAILVGQIKILNHVNATFIDQLCFAEFSSLFCIDLTSVESTKNGCESVVLNDEFLELTREESRVPKAKFIDACARKNKMKNVKEFLRHPQANHCKNIEHCAHYLLFGFY